MNMQWNFQICISVPLIDCVQIWKTSEAANLVFQWIFVLNSVKHRFFHVSIVNTKILINMGAPLISEYHDLFLKYFLRFTYTRKLWDYWFPWLPDLLKKGLLYFNVYRETKSFFDICLIIQNFSFEKHFKTFQFTKMHFHQKIM